MLVAKIGNVDETDEEERQNLIETEEGSWVSLRYFGCLLFALVSFPREPGCFSDKTGPSCRRA